MKPTSYEIDNRLFSIEKVNNNTFLTREYFNGVDLNSYLDGSTVDIKTFLKLAMELLQALEALHKQNIIHKNLSPSCIIVNPENNNIMLNNFGDNSTNIQNSEYMAPEQNNRLQYEVNHTADIYSLGTVFYKMLSGRTPFSTEDDISLLHNQITKQAPTLSQININIPPVISNIIAKMMTINPMERYLQVSSIYNDLSRCFIALQDSETIVDFEIDQSFRDLQFNRVNLLYGREDEIKRINQIFKEINSNDSTMLTVSGSSGVGKSALIHNLLKTNQNLFSHIVKIKFDQYKQNISFEMIYLALRNLVKQVLSEDDKSLQVWKRKLLDMLGEQAGVLINVIPELEAIIGEQPFIQPLSASDSKARLDSLLHQFVQVFSMSNLPLCFYIDDIQWADAVTISWLENILVESSNIIIITSYRDNDLQQEHNFYKMLTKIASLDVNVQEIKLAPMSKKSILALISENMPLKESDDVAEIIFEKTRGNSFFVIQYLKQLQDENAIWFDTNHLTWHCDLQRTKNLPISDNVIDLLSKQIISLPKEVQTLLKIASCIGNRFDAKLLKDVYNNDEQFDSSLNIAMQKSWIKEDSNVTETSSKFYIFLHDRMQQAAHSLEYFYLFTHNKMQQAARSIIETAEIEHIHYAIGNSIKKQHENLENENLFDCVNHLNIAVQLIKTEEELHSLAKLNYTASIYAKKSGDFPVALNYIKKSMELMPKLSEHKDHTSILKARAECEHLCNNQDEAINFYNKAISTASSKLQKASIYELMINFYTDISEFEKAYEIGRVSTKLFDMSIPSKFNPIFLIADFLSLKVKLRSYKTAELLDLPEAQDENIKMLIRLLSALLKVAYQIRPELSVAISIKLVALCLKHGNTKEAVVGYMVFGVIFQGGVLGNHDKGYEYSTLSLSMLERFHNTAQRAEVEFVCGYFALSWKHSAVKTEQNWYLAYHHGLEIGDWFHTGCAAVAIVQSMFMRGVQFDIILHEIENFQKTLKRIGADEQYGTMLGIKQAIHNLRLQTISPIFFDDKEFDEESYIKSINAYGSRHFTHYYYINKMTSLYLHKEYALAFQVSQISKKFLADSIGMLHSTEHYFYRALIAAKIYKRTTSIEQFKCKLSIKKTKKQFKKWAKDSPENFLARLHLIEAELFRINGKKHKAIDSYESAIEVANIYNQTHLKAIANTLLADIYISKQRKEIATLYLDKASTGFKKWGTSVGLSSLINEKSSLSNSLDVTTLMKSAELIAKEHKLPNLLKSLIQITIENAGAQHGVLLLQTDNGLVVQAEASVHSEKVDVMQQVPYMQSNSVVQAIINYVLHAKESIVIDNAQENSIFGQEDIVKERKVKAVLSAPIMLHGKIKGVIYLENNAIPAVFTKDRLELIKHLSGQIAISIENALIYGSLEEKVAMRTRDIDEKNEVLKQQNIELQKQNEKILELNSEIHKENNERKKVEVKLHDAIKKLDLLATTDGLTNLKNRRSFDKALKEECARLTRNNSPLTLLMCDVDSFKAYNDFYGHQMGDEILIQVANVFQASVERTSDIVARYGGEEFAIIMPNTDKEGALKIAQTIHNKLEQLQLPHEHSAVSKQITISIGIATSQAIEGCTPQDMIKTADTALYKAKHAGRNTTIFCEN